ncbi:ribose 5-phosphate isomerase A [Mucilaginibacter myungsuensis]|uniref:Ribose 5-phosphate isomerase A n=1 Tax=Mucilaginibacter myungsuensis TaxID=649104 RepID=A0A929PX65_9SPHI|nr:ribose 5-phosphate isomerase A [Mucilaginibacter myungsuensis]MBE9661912.1 ribose 5-phosphate isomerase A [Mucilaginibacter myungsuensis]MDN3599654.1 ribose 5-phosphate isomerase A [Mucilaginibacter myungsuensis]
MDSLIKSLEWSSEITNRPGKEKVAREIAAKVKDGDVLGVGSGSTVYLALIAIAERVKNEGLNIKAISTSLEISMFCSKLGIPQTTLYEHQPYWLFDGADEVGPGNGLIKGRGGALFKEKLLLASSPLNYIIVDESKQVERLGQNFPIPVEVFPQALPLVANELKKLGAEDIKLRPAKGKDGPVITENNNLILDCRFHHIPTSLEKDIKSITGVIESGLFLGYDVHIMVAGNSL